MATAPTDEVLLDVRDLVIEFVLKKGTLRAVDHVSFRLGRGRTFDLVGESGSGKSVTALSIMRLNPSPPAQTTGEIRFEGRDLLTAPLVPRSHATSASPSTGRPSTRSWKTCRSTTSPSRSWASRSATT